MLTCFKLIGIVLLPCAAASCTGGRQTPDPEAGGAIKTAGVWELVPDWPQVPSGVILGAVSGVAVDSRGNVIAVHRAGRELNEAGLADTAVIRDPVILVFEARSGRLLDSWGEEIFLIPHSVTVDRHEISGSQMQDVSRYSNCPPKGNCC